MRTLVRVVAAMQVALILPAGLFLTSVLVSTGDAPQYDLALVARRIVAWYSGRTWTLWSLLLALPLAVVITGCAALAHSWNGDVEVPNAPRQSLSTSPAPVATLVVAGTTMISAVILTVVVLHMLAN